MSQEKIKTENKGRLSNLTLAILVVILVGLFYFLTLPRPKFIEIDFFDVGQGDAALIETPQNQKVLIDGGPSDVVVSKLDHKIPIFSRSIDAVVLTHPHADHLIGLIKVVDSFDVKSIYFTGVNQNTPEYLELLSKIKAKNIPLHLVKAGDNLDFGKGIRLDFLYPMKNIEGETVENLNETSIVSRLTWGKEAALFTGDLEADGQSELLKTNPGIQAALEKIPHHGSKDGLNSEFQKAVSATYAVISVGKDNQFGHPSQTTISALKSEKVYRTDYDGDVKFSMTENNILPFK